MQSTTSQTFTTKELTKIALVTALTCAVAPISLPIGPVPISLATLILYLGIFILDTKGELISCLAYLLLGLAGLPVFSGFSGGPAKLLGPTGGYLLGYLALVAVAGLCMQHFPKPATADGIVLSSGAGRTQSGPADDIVLSSGAERAQSGPADAIALSHGAGHARNITAAVCGLTAGTLILYLVGTCWFCLQAHASLSKALPLCVLPFLPGDAIKIAAACLIGPKLKLAINRIGA